MLSTIMHTLRNKSEKLSLGQYSLGRNMCSLDVSVGLLL